MKGEEDEEEEQEEEVKEEEKQEEEEEGPPWEQHLQERTVEWLMERQKVGGRRFRLFERGLTAYFPYHDTYHIWEWLWGRRKRKWFCIDGDIVENPFYRGPYGQREQRMIQMEDGTWWIDQNAYARKWTNRELAARIRKRREKETQKRKRRQASKMARQG